MGITLELDVDAVAGVLVVTAAGSLVAGGLEPLRRCLASVIDGGRPVVVDCLAVEQVDGEGVRLLRDAPSRLGTRMRVVVERHGPIHRALKDAGLAHVLALHASQPAALAAAASAGAGRFARSEPAVPRSS